MKSTNALRSAYWGLVRLVLPCLLVTQVCSANETTCEEKKHELREKDAVGITLGVFSNRAPDFLLGQFVYMIRDNLKVSASPGNILLGKESYAGGLKYLTDPKAEFSPVIGIHGGKLETSEFSPTWFSGQAPQSKVAYVAALTAGVNFQSKVGLYGELEGCYLAMGPAEIREKLYPGFTLGWMFKLP